MDIYRKTSHVVRYLHPDGKTKRLEIKVAVFISPRGQVWCVNKFLKLSQENSCRFCVTNDNKLMFFAFL